MSVGLEVVRVADHLLRADRQAHWLTERQLRHAQVCHKCIANRRAWRRRPDGVLISGRREVALELELTSKWLDQYTAILDAYARHPEARRGDGWDQSRWWTPCPQAPRVTVV